MAAGPGGPGTKWVRWQDMVATAGSVTPRGTWGEPLALAHTWPLGLIENARHTRLCSKSSGSATISVRDLTSYTLSSTTTLNCFVLSNTGIWCTSVWWRPVCRARMESYVYVSYTTITSSHPCTYNTNTTICKYGNQRVWRTSILDAIPVESQSLVNGLSLCLNYRLFTEIANALNTFWLFYALDKIINFVSLLDFVRCFFGYKVPRFA